MTGETASDLERAVLESAATWGPHALSFRGARDGRFAACSCQGWRLAVGDRTAADVLAEFAGHLRSAPNENESPPSGVARSRLEVGLAQTLRGRAASQEVSNARAVTAQLFWGGFLLSVVGYAVALSTSDTTVAALGWAIGSIAGLPAFVGLLAWGVRLGIESSSRSPS